jgi:hypothetical protein
VALVMLLLMFDIKSFVDIFRTIVLSAGFALTTGFAAAFLTATGVTDFFAGAATALTGVATFFFSEDVIGTVFGGTNAWIALVTVFSCAGVRGEALTVNALGTDFTAMAAFLTATGVVDFATGLALGVLVTMMSFPLI